jgi:hypothetical protein
VSANGTVGFGPETTRWTGNAAGLEGAERVPDTSDPLCQIRYGYLTSDPANPAIRPDYPIHHTSYARPATPSPVIRASRP